MLNSEALWWSCFLTCLYWLQYPNQIWQGGRFMGCALIHYSWVDYFIFLLFIFLSKYSSHRLTFCNASIFIDVFLFSSYLRFKIHTILSIMVLFKAWSTYGELRALGGCSKGMALIVLELSLIQQLNSSAMSKHPSMLLPYNIMFMIWFIFSCYCMPKMSGISIIVIILFCTMSPVSFSHLMFFFLFNLYDWSFVFYLFLYVLFDYVKI